MKKSFLFAFALSFAAMLNAQKETKLYVSEVREYCLGVAVTPKKCLLIRENPNSEWINFSNPIEGFEYKEGYKYELLVKAHKIKNPYNDPTAVEYDLIKVIKRTKVSNLQSKSTVVIANDSIRSPQDRRLSGKWRLSELNGLAIPDSSKITLHFRETNKYGGNAGCNAYFGAYTPNADSIHFSFGPMTRMACYPAEIMKLESEYLKTLRQSATFRKTETQLEILDKEGKILAKYIPAHDEH